MNNKILGTNGESMAVDFLKTNGYKIIQQNYRTRTGEIDIIATIDKMLCFIEVKTRKSRLFGEPYESVNYHKQKKIRSAAVAFINANHFSCNSMRFDVISIYIDSDDKNHITHISGAF